MVLVSSTVQEDGWRLEVDGHKVFLSAREKHLLFSKKRSEVTGVVCILLHVWQLCDLECSEGCVEVVEVVILSLRSGKTPPTPILLLVRPEWIWCLRPGPFTVSFAGTFPHWEAWPEIVFFCFVGFLAPHSFQATLQN